MKRHPKLPLEASATHWSAAGYAVFSNTDEVGQGPHGFDELLILALHQGHQGDAAICAAILERQRRHEEGQRNRSSTQLAEAIVALAKAVSPMEVRVLLERVLPSLSGPAQEAVRNALR